ncbi:hypothetical protein E1288_44235 [Saccharopolyspora elongata]|uniref:Uncharacterized protein n=1 Tax=Saccharopolyspora elongata TaxID=2530387 RepID=A0A4R4XSR3_9PSEU|nr:hypothetical protein E1288_44235 [Saccharopolyspora elongata]
MRPPLHNRAAAENDDLVRSHDRGQPARDDDDGLASDQGSGASGDNFVELPGRDHDRVYGNVLRPFKVSAVEAIRTADDMIYQLPVMIAAQVRPTTPRSPRYCATVLRQVLEPRRPHRVRIHPSATGREPRRGGSG